MDKNLRLRILLEAVDRAVRPMKAVDRASEVLGRKIKATVGELADLKRAQSDLSKLQKLESETVDLGLKMTEARRRVTQLRDQLVATKNPSDKLQASFNKAKSTVADLERTQRSHAGALNDVRSKLQAAGVELGSMARAEKTLADRVKATTAALDGQREKLKQVDARKARALSAKATFGKWGGRAGAAAATGVGLGATAAAAGGPIMDTANTAADFGSMMTTISQKADLSRKDSTALGLELLEISDRVNRLPDEIQAAADVLTGFGLDTRIAVRLTDPIGKTATAYKGSMDEIGAATFAVHDNLKVAVEELPRALDIMAYSGKKGAFELKDMAASFPSLTASAQGLGHTGTKAVADIAAALQIVRKGAGSSEQAATNLDNLLQKIGSPTTAKNFAKLGINLEKEMKKAAKAGESPIEAITKLTNKALKGDLGRLGYIFEDSETQKALRPLIQNYQEYIDIRREAGNAKGVIDADFAERMRDDQEALNSFNVQMAQTKIAVGQMLLPVITPLLAKTGQMARDFRAWTKEHPKLAAGLGKISVVGAAIIAVLGVLALVIVPIVVIVGALTAAAGFLGVTVGGLIGLIAAVIALIVALGVAVWGLIKGWDKIGPAAGRAWQAVLDRVRLVLNDFASLHVRFFQMGVHLMSGLAKGIGSALGQVKDAIFSAGESVVGWFKSKLGIHSPSRVFAGLGGHMMDGLAIGLEKSSKGPTARVGQIADRLAKGAAIGAAAFALPAVTMASPIITAPGGVAPGSALIRPPAAGQAVTAAPGDKYEIHIHAAPGMDEHALARLVAQELDKRDRARAAASRSSLRDQGD